MSVVAAVAVGRGCLQCAPLSVSVLFVCLVYLLVGLIVGGLAESMVGWLAWFVLFGVLAGWL